MSKATRMKFARSITAQHDRYRSVLNLAGPEFRYDGFISYATMDGAAGSVEVVCGPPEYHAEVSVTMPKDGERWSLARLMEISSVRRWVMAQPAEQSGQSAVDVDIEWIFRLLKHGLLGADEFRWLYRAQ